ncbi:MAG: succinate dehydrogenase cytochrome b subunit [Ornithinimicrobium sp.]|uniref:succinate dehydrogenase cytochrome b subunit n=1 Tax=Ornithinimicrobium sp. TaxID=1977084 RepID=UPI0026E03E39|nr:succinate dehydrogenase cytochrome b subunit [Ornithinimicrobium sp.]MDO5740404.1 succinate dehydrogenase cytochrome b subunit [Ornithinimicrobium sp.]
MATTTLPARPTRTGPPSVLLKMIMAVTGLFFLGFLLVHMYGNLQILLGHEAFDEYAHHIRTFGAPMLPERGLLWVLRLGLLAAVGLHIWSAVTLWGRANRARPTKYVAKRVTYGGFYSRAMRWGGLAIAAFVIFHILHFTTQTVTIGAAHASPAARVVDSFSHWWGVLIYVVAMIFLGLHLLHGIWGAAMTLGLNTSFKRAEQIRFVSILVVTIVVVGFLIPPLGILFGLVK